MTIKESKPMREIHRIREQIYKDTKGKDITGVMKYIKQTAAKLNKKSDKTILCLTNK